MSVTSWSFSLDGFYKARFLLKSQLYSNEIDIAPGPQKVPKLYFQSQFSMSKINRIVSKKKSSKNMNFGDHYTVVGSANGGGRELFDMFLKL